MSVDMKPALEAEQRIRASTERKWFFMHVVRTDLRLVLDLLEERRARLDMVRCWLLGCGTALACGDTCEGCKRDCYVAEGLRILDGRKP